MASPRIWIAEKTFFFSRLRQPVLKKLVSISYHLCVCVSRDFFSRKARKGAKAQRKNCCTNCRGTRLYVDTKFILGSTRPFYVARTSGFSHLNSLRLCTFACLA